MNKCLTEFKEVRSQDFVDNVGFEKLHVSFSLNDALSYVLTIKNHQIRWFC